MSRCQQKFRTADMTFDSKVKLKENVLKSVYMACHAYIFRICKWLIFVTLTVYVRGL